MITLLIFAAIENTKQCTNFTAAEAKQVVKGPSESYMLFSVHKGGKLVTALAILRP